MFLSIQCLGACRVWLHWPAHRGSSPTASPVEHVQQGPSAERYCAAYRLIMGLRFISVASIYVQGFKTWKHQVSKTLSSRLWFYISRNIYYRWAEGGAFKCTVDMFNDARLIKKHFFFFWVAFLRSKAEFSFLSHTLYGVIIIYMIILKLNTEMHSYCGSTVVQDCCR